MLISCFGDKWSKTTFSVGLFQLLLAYLLIGWVLSIYWGYIIVRKSFEDDDLNKFLSS